MLMANARATVVCVKVANIRPEWQDLRAWCEDPANVYIGRGRIVFVDVGGAKVRYPPADSVFANPFKVGKDGTREQVVAKYRAWLKGEIQRGAITRGQLEALKGKRLGCWCHPQRCHGDVLAAVVNGL